MYYDKRIRYLSYYESDIKLQNAGYVKFQVRDSLCQMIIFVKGPRLMGSGEAAVYLLSRNRKESDGDSFYTGSRDSRLQKHLLGNLSIRGGQGHCAVRLDAENMADSGLRYDEICGVKIMMHEYQYLESQWSVVNSMPERQKSGESGTAGYRLRKEQNGGCVAEEEEAPVEVNLIVTPVSERSRCVSNAAADNGQSISPPDQGVLENDADKEQNACGAENEDDGNSTEDGPQIIVITGEPAENTQGSDEDSMQGMLEREIRRENAAAEILQAEQTESKEQHELPTGEEQTLEEEIITGMRSAENGGEESEAQLTEQELQPDKWEQLRKTYPIVHPIREEEEYLKITPKDFVVFTEKYQELVHNSFLLHGYYNYKHLILGRKEKDGRVLYYLGVPGTFHDREKSVAVMFGFEAFDGKREPAEKGDFGYYLRRVEI